MNKLQALRRENIRQDTPDFQTGDTVRVNTRIVEAGSERVQPFTGMVIAMNGSAGQTTSVTVRRISYGQGVERVFPLDSPRIGEISIIRKAKHKDRAKLYYLRYKKGRIAGMR